jgi:hypothetical protein
VRPLVEVLRNSELICKDECWLFGIFLNSTVPLSCSRRRAVDCNFFKLRDKWKLRTQNFGLNHEGRIWNKIVWLGIFFA